MAEKFIPRRITGAALRILVSTWSWMAIVGVAGIGFGILIANYVFEDEPQLESYWDSPYRSFDLANGDLASTGFNCDDELSTYSFKYSSSSISGKNGDGVNVFFGMGTVRGDDRYNARMRSDKLFYETMTMNGISYIGFEGDDGWYSHGEQVDPATIRDVRLSENYILCPDLTSSRWKYVGDEEIFGIPVKRYTGVLSIRPDTGRADLWVNSEGITVKSEFTNVRREEADTFFSNEITFYYQQGMSNDIVPLKRPVVISREDLRACEDAARR